MQSMLRKHNSRVTQLHKGSSGDQFSPCSLSCGLESHFASQNSPALRGGLQGQGLEGIVHSRGGATTSCVQVHQARMRRAPHAVVRCGVVDISLKHVRTPAMTSQLQLHLCRRAYHDATMACSSSTLRIVPMKLLVHWANMFLNFGCVLASIELESTVLLIPGGEGVCSWGAGGESSNREEGCFGDDVTADVHGFLQLQSDLKALHNLVLGLHPAAVILN